MPRLIVLCFLVCYLPSFAQFSDMLSVRKKSGRVIKTFYAGSPVKLQTTDGMYIEGPIKDIRHDSVFVMLYDIRTVMTNLGVTVVDTVSRYLVGLPYTDILRIEVYTYHRFVRGKAGTLLTLGGAGYFGLNVINHLIYNQSLTKNGNAKRLEISAGAFGLGYIINHFFAVNRYSHKKQKIVYVHIK